MQELPSRFDQILSRRAAKACLSDPVVGSLAPGAVVAIPQRVVRRLAPPWPAPPIASMISVGGGGGDVRARLYLWMWATTAVRAVESGYRRSSGEWAVLLNLIPSGRELHREIRGACARRVATAASYMCTQRLLQRGSRDVLAVLDPNRSGAIYRAWTDAEIAERERQRATLAGKWGSALDFRYAPGLWEEEPLRLPAAIWLNGTISALKAPALAVLLALWDQERHADELIWMPKIKRSQYGIRHDTWTTGTKQLLALGCLTQVRGDVVFPAGVNSRVSVPRYRIGLRIHHRRLEAMHREQLPAEMFPRRGSGDA